MFTANWFYPHDAADHYQEDIEENGSRVRNDDSINETKHKYKKEAKKRVFGGGRRMQQQYWPVKLRVPDRDADGKETGTFHITMYKKRANMPDFQAIQRREAITSQVEMKKAPPRLLTARSQEVKAEKAGKRQSGQGATRDGMLALKNQV